jgi:hypothetical protein
MTQRHHEYEVKCLIPYWVTFKLVGTQKGINGHGSNVAIKPIPNHHTLQGSKQLNSSKQSSDYSIVSPKMQLSKLIVLFAGIAAAVPTPEEVGPSGHEVEIKGFTYAGSGCKANTVGHMLSTDQTTLTLIFGEDFTVQSGKGIQPKERRRNCQLNVKLHYPQGWQFSILKADYRGHATIPKGSSGTCSATYYFSGSSQQARPVEPTS